MDRADLGQRVVEIVRAKTNKRNQMKQLARRCSVNEDIGLVEISKKIHRLELRKYSSSPTSSDLSERK